MAAGVPTLLRGHGAGRRRWSGAAALADGGEEERTEAVRRRCETDVL